MIYNELIYSWLFLGILFDLIQIKYDELNTKSN